MMSDERNKVSKEILSEELKLLKSRCIDAINIIENSSPLELEVPPENVARQSLNYVEGLKNELQNSHTPICTDENILTAQFLYEMQEKKKQLQESAAFIKGTICDVDKEIESLETQLRTTEQAKTYQTSQHQIEVTLQHIEKAKQRFFVLRNHLFGLIESLYTSHADDMKTILSKLLKAHTSTDPSVSKYIAVSEEYYPLIEILLGLNLVTLHPYDKTSIKLAY